MDSEIKALWVEALRSGEYKQGRYMLRSDVQTYCCLGVLKHLIEGDESVGNSSYGDGLYDEATACGLTRDVQWNLVNMNDQGKTFTEIADYIEANL